MTSGLIVIKDGKQKLDFTLKFEYYEPKEIYFDQTSQNVCNDTGNRIWTCFQNM